MTDNDRGESAPVGGAVIGFLGRTYPAKLDLDIMCRFESEFGKPFHSTVLADMQKIALREAWWLVRESSVKHGNANGNYLQKLFNAAPVAQVSDIYTALATLLGAALDGGEADDHPT